ncbi:hypothetical protein TARUN_2759 [Trichoderma arundinaceum]|uniref:Uncharacterized protein n=1 Tax=Trichoderma arundinaceum TaxID=490622 RepID=A0A395NTR8_TRIAR|nr:hypothetical protein TARUN_2759 [Trichoderma arundinaceum]
MPWIASSRVDALEGKIEELTAQLIALRNGHGAASAAVNDTTSSAGSASVPDVLREGGPASEEQLLEAETEGYHGREPPTISVLEGIPDVIDRGFLSADEAESLVAQFKARFMWKFPFVVVPPSQTVSELRRQEPLLFLAVIAATIPSAHPIRKLLADEIMQHITSRIVASSERNLERERATGSAAGSSFIFSVDSSYGELSGTASSSHEESFIKAMVGANLRQFDSLKDLLEKEMAKCPMSSVNIFNCNMHYINIAIRDMALEDEYLSYQSHRASSQSRSAEAFKTSAYRSSLLWHLLRHSKALINAYIDIPDAELPQVTVFTLAQLCASLVILPRSASALLKLIVRHGSGPTARRAKVQGDALSEAQAIIDEADFLNLVVRLYDRLKTLIVGLSPQEKGLDVTGTLCCHMSVLASWYGPRVNAILGIDLVADSPLASMTPPGAAVIDAINASAAVNAANLIPQQSGRSIDGLGSADGQEAFPGAYVGSEGYLFSDDLWSSVLESFTNFK